MDDYDLWCKARSNIRLVDGEKEPRGTSGMLFDVLGVKNSMATFNTFLGQAYSNGFDAETRRKMALLASPFGVALIKKKLRELGKLPPANE